MSKVNLFALAESNCSFLDYQFQQLQLGLEYRDATTLQSFIEMVERRGVVSINMRQITLHKFLLTGKYENIYEWAGSQGEYSSKSIEELLRLKLGEYYEGRIAFDGYFEDGHRFRYGALNIGGIGPDKFGDFCAVLGDRRLLITDQLAYLRSDSLKTYLEPNLGVIHEKLEKDLAPHTHRQYLAAMKYFERVSASEESSWGSLVCSNSEYIEAVFTATLTPDDLTEVRVLNSDYEFFFHFLFEDYREKLDECERSWLGVVELIIRGLAKLGIPLRLV